MTLPTLARPPVAPRPGPFGPEEVGGMTASGRPRPYSILITDDDAGSRETLREIVEVEGYQTRLRVSGEGPLKILLVGGAARALLDIKMPRLPGLETLQCPLQATAVLPSSLVPADATEFLIRQAMRMRAYSVIPKPVSKHV